MNVNGNKLWNEGMEFLNKKKYILAIEKFKKGHLYFEEKKNKLGMSSCLLGLGLGHLGIDKIDDALKNFEDGLKIVKELNFRPGIASLLMNRGLLFQKIRQFNKALIDYNTSLGLFTKINDVNSIKNLKLLIDNCKKELLDNKKLKNSS